MVRRVYLLPKRCSLRPELSGIFLRWVICAIPPGVHPRWRRRHLWQKITDGVSMTVAIRWEFADISIVMPYWEICFINWQGHRSRLPIGERVKEFMKLIWEESLSDILCEEIGTGRYILRCRLYLCAENVIVCKRGKRRWSYEDNSHSGRWQQNNVQPQKAEPGYRCQRKNSKAHSGE